MKKVKGHKKQIKCWSPHIINNENFSIYNKYVITWVIDIKIIKEKYSF